MGVRDVLYRFRSSITGRFVKKSTASRHPRETVAERIDQHLGARRLGERDVPPNSTHNDWSPDR